MKIAKLFRYQNVKVFGLPAVVEAVWYGAQSWHALFSFGADDYVNLPDRVILHSGEENHLEPA